MSPRRILRFGLLAIIAICASAQDAAPKSRLQRVQEEVEMRRMARDDAQGESGLVVAPLAYPDSWFAQPREWKVDGASLILCGQTFATLARKEVMISGRIAKRKITVSIGSVSSEKALDAFRSAIESQGIAIVPVSSRVLALVDATEIPTKKQG